MAEYSKKLVAPNGKEFEARSAREANDLIFGHGYHEAESGGSKSKAKATTKADSKTEESA